MNFINIILFIFILFILLKFYFKSKRKKGFTIGFFHPFCNAGGGGERVLWCCIRAIQSYNKDIKCVVYTGDTEATPKILIENVEKKFGITFKEEPEFVFLKTRVFIEPSTWPFVTILFQNMGALIVAFEALNKRNPDVFIDTMGVPFAFPIFKFFGGSKISCYVHYPTISSDMLARVKNPIKKIYYQIFTIMYTLVGKLSKVTMTNSSWTNNHIKELWKSKSTVVFPPVDTFELQKIEFNNNLRKNIISISQFRPEKNQKKQIKSLAKLIELYPDCKDCQLTLIGGVRNKEDEDRVQMLKNLSKSLNVENNVNFKVGVSNSELKELLGSALIGIHTMTDEHFGIGVVEFLAAGVIAIAHNSAGPKYDIIQNEKTGFLASKKEEYANYIYKILNMNKNEIEDIQINARESVQRFSEEEFENCFINCMKDILPSSK